jgi:hypothetical protein
VTNYDSDPSQIVTTDTRRDSSLGDQDSFQMIFDTYLDSQNGFVFGTNALGAEYDAQVRSQDNPTTSWDGSWEVEPTSAFTGWRPPAPACSLCSTTPRRSMASVP